MTPEKEQALQEHLDAIGKIIYEETEPNQLQDLETIEKTVRDKIQSHVSPTIGSFFIKKATGTDKGRKRKLKSCLGKLTITEKQCQRLVVKPNNQLSFNQTIEKGRSAGKEKYQKLKKFLGIFIVLKLKNFVLI